MLGKRMRYFGGTGSLDREKRWKDGKTHEGTALGMGKQEKAWYIFLM